MPNVANRSADDSSMRTDLYHGLFRWHKRGDGQPCVMRHAEGANTVPCPTTGRPLRIATIEANTAAICPACASHGHGGFVSFVGDLRMAYACPLCCELIWLAGA
jgi:hypothetical protein